MLPDASKSFAYNPEANAGEHLPRDIINLYGRLDHAREVPVRKGG